MKCFVQDDNDLWCQDDWPRNSDGGNNDKGNDGENGLFANAAATRSVIRSCGGSGVSV